MRLAAARFPRGGRNPLRRQNDETERRVTTLEDNGGRGGLRNAQGTVGRGGRENEKFPHLCPAPSDQDPVVSVAVSIVSTGGLVSIGYGAFLIRMSQATDYNFTSS